MANTPRGREKNVTGQGKDVYRRGSGLGTGPVGNAGGYKGRGGNSGGGGKRSGGGMNPLMLIILAVIMLGGGGGGLSALLSGGDSASYQTTTPSYTQQQTQSQQTQQTTTQTPKPGYSGNPYGTLSGSGMLSSLLGGSSVPGSSTSSGWSLTNNNGKLDTSVASGARDKRTQIKGNNKDKVTIMVYMCGADLESRSGMATSDLSEMAGADISDNVNIIVYTGGASAWKNSIVSNKTTQIYKVEKGGLKRLENDMGNVSMTQPSTLTKFIKYCAERYPANRNELIFWDHGGGSITGYGHDEKFMGSGSMNLKGISDALKQAGTTFDFIGFDACLMATVENALMLDSYADYLVASEETEPGVGWYYTNWLTKLSKNPSMPTLEIGKNIADDFVSVCAQKCQGQKTTLSVIDLAELKATVPSELSDFASATTKMMQNNEFQTVSQARAGAREFAVGTKIDQVDFVDFVSKVGTQEGKDLAKALLGAVKYNRTANNMNNAYGLSIYWPYANRSTVRTALATYDAIGMNQSYSDCISKFASLQSGGQAVAGGSSSPFSSPFGSLSGYGGYGSSYSGSSSQSSSSQSSTYGSSYDSSAYNSEELISALLESLMGGRSLGSVEGLTESDSDWLNRSLEPEQDTQYLLDHRFLDEQLVWMEGMDGQPSLYMSEDQWNLVNDLELSLFLDDGEGYIDLGLDNVYTINDDGGLSGVFDGTWLAINDQPVAYYHMDTVDDGENYTITGRVPAMLNDERVDLILVFDNENPYGYVAGARVIYDPEVTEALSKDLLELEEGDVIDFLCDYYTYDNEYIDSFFLGDQMIVDEDLTISNVYVDEAAANACYRFTDIYGQDHWTPVMNH